MYPNSITICVRYSPPPSFIMLLTIFRHITIAKTVEKFGRLAKICDFGSQVCVRMFT